VSTTYLDDDHDFMEGPTLLTHPITGDGGLMIGFVRNQRETAAVTIARRDALAAGQG
jgi:hypothetical protein